MKADLANLNLEDEDDEEDEEPISCEKDSIETKDDYRFCLVGKVLTDCVVHFLFLKKTLANLWHPLGGVSITDIGEKRYVFCFSMR
ncbi:hypothetical protein ES332_A12G094400v1 [Gossypium tomentosum]|uniref:DUF4283 domain-containing protein n=1 Tax=Gossypium tomentosum TaxID=34277 RepID=A0A5D2MXV2_GOSTO|nr:hypothetical protein ES332_A12G094400v1 [Gossypium tomentosum]